jgi:hypothetical protein
MISVERVDTASKSQVDDFVKLHYRLYKGTPQWVPPFANDIKLMLNRNKHPFYEHSDAEFFVARQKSEIVGRIAVMDNKPFNQYHDVRKAQFYLYDTVDDQEVSNCLFGAAFDWCKKRKLDTLIGPKGFSLFDGYGIQIEGTDKRQMMTMMNYNFDYYPRLVESIGFEKEVDFVSCYLSPKNFSVPEKVREVARRVRERGKFKVLNFNSKRELLKYAQQIGIAYNKTFVKNWEYYPQTEREIQYVVDTILLVAVPQLIKLITYEDEIVGFLFGFPDISAALQRHGGSLNPISIVDIMLELKKTKWISLNGAGVLPEFHGRGGNALLYAEMEDTLKGYHYEHGELTQVAETTQQMRKDLITLGGQPYKNHRVYRRQV